MTWTGPIEGIPFRTCRNPRSSLYLDLDTLEYDEQEWFISGSADAVDIDGHIVADSAPFVTRCLVRRPLAESSGVTYIEPFHALDEDTPAWSNSWRHLIRNRHTWIGVTTTTGSFSLDGRPDAGGLARLKKFDSARYDLLQLYDPGVTTGRMSLGADGRLTSKSRESSGMLDMQASGILRQVAEAIGFQSKRIFAVGFSQTAGTWSRYLAHGASAFDGYVLAVGGTPLARPSDAAVVSLLSESELTGTLVPPMSVPADSDHPRFRGYEVPGSFHYWTVKSTRVINHGVPHSDKPWDVLYHAVLANLETWSEGGLPMPCAPRVERDGTNLIRDTDEHLLGGLRAPWLEVPDGRYSGSCSCSPVMGRFDPFSPAELRQRYGTTYQDRLRRSAEELVSKRWLLSQDLERAISGVA